MTYFNKSYFIKNQEKDFILIQLLRGLAASLVVFFHFTGFVEFHTDNLFYFLSANEEIGVWIFFAISGYVISYSADSKIFKKKGI